LPTWVCLLRGVNLVRQRRLAMPALRDALTAAGMSGVRTYLQSGNVVADSPHTAPEAAAAFVRNVIATELSLDVQVIARRPADIQQVIAANPFPAESAQRPHLVRVIFLSATPHQADADRLLADPALHSTCRLAGSHVYLDYVDSYHGTARTAAYVARVLGVSGTERNWRTVLALADLCAAR
jgi:uncharacterized protein (DUF1697 family)